MTAFKGVDKIAEYLQAKLDEHVRPEVQALVKRGNITLEEWMTFRGNSWEFEHMYCALDDEAFAYAVEHTLRVVSFVFGARIFDQRIGVQNVIADLRAPAGRLARTQISERFGVLLELHLRETAF